MPTADYATSIASRGASKSERRAELSDAMFDASEGLMNAARDLREALVCHLEKQPYAKSVAAAETAFISVDAAFEDARVAATRFLLDEGDIKVEEA